MYAREITETSKSALLELGLSLQMYQNDMVLSGGWAPYFITENYFEHCGSIDIDLVLKTTIMPNMRVSGRLSPILDMLRKTISGSQKT